MYAFIACGIWLIGLGTYFMFLRPPLLPEDLRYIGTTAGELQSAMPELESWTHRVFRVMGGFMSGTGVLTSYVSSPLESSPRPLCRCSNDIAARVITIRRAGTDLA